MNTKKQFKLEMQQLQAKLKTMPEADIANFLQTLDEHKRALALTLLNKEVLAEVFSLLDSDDKETLLSSFTQPEIKELLDDLDADDLVDTLQELPSNVVSRLLKQVDPEKRPIINHLLRYPENSVGSLMNTDYVAVKPTSNKTAILDKINASPAEHEHLHMIFIINDNRELIGYIYLADLVRLQGEGIADIIHWNPISIWTRADQEEAAKLFQKHYLLSLPVKDSENRLVGIVTADDMFEIIAEEIREDYTLMQGMGVTTKPYLETSVFELSRKRIVWLLLLMLSATLTGAIIEGYQAVLASTVVLAAYIPMLMDSGGNSGSQSSTLIIQSMAMDEITMKDASKVLWKEFRVGLTVGGTMAVVNFARMMLFGHDNPKIAIVVSVTLLFTIVLAKLIGGSLPLLAKRLKQDPAVMAGPMVTTVVDAAALVVYFQIASLLLGLG